MASNYQEKERAKAVDLIKSVNEVFYGATAGKMFMTKERDFVLHDSLRNIFSPVCNDVLEYFDKNDIMATSLWLNMPLITADQDFKKIDIADLIYFER